MQSPTMEPTETQTLPLQTVTTHPPTATESNLALTNPQKPVCVTLIYSEYAQFEIISPSGQRVLLDVHDPSKLTHLVVESDVLLTTHTHWDHWNEDFQKAFPGMQLFVQTGVLEAPGAVIQGLASAHNAGDRLKPEGGTNYIYLIEMGGFRIAHFGDIGQKILTEDQLNVLGTVDIAITQINNPYSEMDAQNRKGINLMEQLQPRFVIPTHFNLDTVKLAVAQWNGFSNELPSVQICESDLNQESTQFLLVGEAVETMKKYVDLTQWGER